MKRKLVLWGNNAKDEKILIGLELVAEEKIVNIYTLKEEEVTKELNDHLFTEWRESKVIGFPSESATHLKRELTISDTILPDDLRTNNTELVSRAQTEWHFVVLSTKLNETYQQEIDTLKDRIEKLENFDNSIWEDLRGFWEKVQSQIREKNLYREHSKTLKDKTNNLFDAMKLLRKKVDEEFREISKKNKVVFHDALVVFEEKVAKGIRLEEIFSELKDLQKRFKDSDLVRKDRNDIWKKIDGLFKIVKERRFGNSDQNKRDNNPSERISRRRDGLVKAIDRMRNSIKKDEGDLKYHSGKEGQYVGQLEKQLKEAKMKMIQERIDSKKEKYDDMLKTMESLDKKLADIAEKDRLRKLKADAKKEAADKIKAEIKKSEEAMASKKEELEKAAKIIAEDKRPKVKKAKTMPDTAEDKLTVGTAAVFSADLQLSINQEEE